MRGWAYERIFDYQFVVCVCKCAQTAAWSAKSERVDVPRVFMRIDRKLLEKYALYNASRGQLRVLIC